MIRLLRLSRLLCLILLVCAAWAQKQADDVRYLVIRLAGTPEKNYYELARDVAIIDPLPRFFPGADVETKEPGGIRYDVHAIWKVRVHRITDSQKEPVSTNDGFYVLVYERDPDVRFCGVRYEVHSLPSGGRNIEYTDCETKKSYSFPMTSQWPRPFVIYEVEVLDRDALRSVWQRQHDRRGSDQNTKSSQSR